MNNFISVYSLVKKNFKGITPKYVTTSNILVLNQRCIRNNKIDFSLAQHHDKNKQFSKNKILKIGDILINSTGQGTAGRCALIKELPKDKIVITDSHILVLRIDEFYDAGCLEYYLYNIQDKLQSFMDGSTGQGEFDKEILFNIKLKLPIKHKRRKVYKFLNTIDSKIELNNKINSELENLAKLIYDYWFVQFDFPDEKGNPYKSSGGKMVWNDELKKEIPEGWNVGAFDDIGDVIGGSTPSRSNDEYFTKNGTPWITPKDLSLNIGKKFISKGEIDVTELGIKNASLNLLPKGTILLSSRAPIGYMAISRNEVTTNQGFKSIVPKDSFSSEYVFYTVQTYIDAMIQYASGSTFSEISASTLKMIKIPIPNAKLVHDFTKKIESIFTQQDILEQENERLEQLRDWLLPMLMNGQVKVVES